MRRMRLAGWAGLGWARLGWAGLDWAGLGWAGLSWLAGGWLPGCLAGRLARTQFCHWSLLILRISTKEAKNRNISKDVQQK